MYRCAQLQHDIELYGGDLLWALAEAGADVLVAQLGIRIDTEEEESVCWMIA